MLIRFNMILGAAVSGFGRAAAVMASEQLARGEEDRARTSVDDALVIALVLFSVVGGLVALFPGAVLGAFFDDPGVIEAGRDAVRVLGASAPVLAIRGVLGGAMTALGSTSAVGWRGLARRFGSILPLAWLLGVVAGFGLVAVAAIEAVEAVVGALLAWRQSRQKSWTRKASQNSDYLAGFDDA
jgi:Na+-driven multidrug efflux pump